MASPAPRNPFTPTFGSVPLFMAGREHIVRDIARGFDNGPGDPNLSTIFTGPRGTGKTALLSYLSQEALGHGWISANVSAAPGMLEDILERATEAAQEFVSTAPEPRIKGIHVGAVGVDWEYGSHPEGNWRTKMNALLKELDRFDVGLLITVDEVRVDLDEMLQLVTVYQHFIREGRRVALLMAGLPYKVSTLLRNDSVSFLRRAQRHGLGRIPDYEITNALIKTIEQSGRQIEMAALDHAVEAIGGFPFMMQLVGYRMWDAHADASMISAEDAVRGALLAKAEFRERVLETTYRELSDGDLRFLAAMLPDKNGESRMTDIADRMGVSSGYVSQYRKRLLEDGIIGEKGRGVVGVELPAFKDFLEERFAD